MKHVDNIHTYNDSLLQWIVNGILPFFDLWSLRSFENQRYEHVSGNCNEIEKFSQYVSEYSTGENQNELLLIVANCEKNYPTVMLNTSKKYMIIKFVNNSEYLGEPLYFPPYSNGYF